MARELNSREAIYGFVAWLTTRDQKTVIGASNMVDLMETFCEANNLPEFSDDWVDNLIRPSNIDI